MIRTLSFAVALLIAPPLLLPIAGNASERALPMQFNLVLQGPADSCAGRCKTYVTAHGAITADTPRHFLKFAKGRDLTGATIVLDSDGGSVHGAIALGREIRKRALDTTVGRVAILKSAEGGEVRGTLTPQADCESMCAFVLLGGVHRVVPPEARVMVHQIWLGDRRDDPTAANYSAEDLVLVQRDIGRLAQFTAEMGVSIDMLDLSLRIPPWEPMHALSREELRSMRVATELPEVATGAAVAATPPAPAAPPVSRLTNGVQSTAISDRRWVTIDHEGTTALARRHPLTVAGESIGSFDLLVSCGQGGDSYEVSYIERRYDGERLMAPKALGSVTMRVGGLTAPLKVVSSQRHDSPAELTTVAAGHVPSDMVAALAGTGSRSVTIETSSAGVGTAIRLGNTGVRQSLPGLSAVCSKKPGTRADLPAARAGGLALAK